MTDEDYLVELWPLLLVSKTDLVFNQFQKTPRDIDWIHTRGPPQGKPRNDDMARRPERLDGGSYRIHICRRIVEGVKNEDKSPRFTI
jgi:hypothetical protein